jgi:hypothetical protein
MKAPENPWVESIGDADLVERITALAKNHDEVLIAVADGGGYGNAWFHCFVKDATDRLEFQFEFFLEGLPRLKRLVAQLPAEVREAVALGHSDKMPNRPLRNVWRENPFQLFVNGQLNAWVSDNVLTFTLPFGSRMEMSVDNIEGIKCKEHGLLPIHSVRVRLTSGSTHCLTWRWYFEPFLISNGWELDWCEMLIDAVKAELD